MKIKNNEIGLSWGQLVSNYSNQDHSLVRLGNTLTDTTTPVGTTQFYRYYGSD